MVSRQLILEERTKRAPRRKFDALANVALLKDRLESDTRYDCVSSSCTSMNDLVQLKMSTEKKRPLWFYDTFPSHGGSKSSCFFF